MAGIVVAVFAAALAGLLVGIHTGSRALGAATQLALSVVPFCTAALVKTLATTQKEHDDKR